jgi:hypothetical protein
VLSRANSYISESFRNTRKAIGALGKYEATVEFSEESR